MNKSGWIMIGIVVLVLVAMVVAFFWTMNVKKGEIVLVNEYDAQSNTVETTLDGMRKTLINQFKRRHSRRTSSRLRWPSLKVVRAGHCSNPPVKPRIGWVSGRRST